MIDLIDRQTAIGAVNNAFDRETLLAGFVRSIAVRAIRDVPSAQPKPDKNPLPEQPDSDRLGVKTGETCTDTISRQAAIDAIIKADYEFTGILSEPRARRFEQTINALPSAQPDLPSSQPDLSEYSDKLWRNAYERGKAEAQVEIIRCRDCRYYKEITSIHGDCECGEMWQSLFGEVTEVEAIEVHKDHYCGYAERRTDEQTISE